MHGHGKWPTSFQSRGNIEAPRPGTLIRLVPSVELGIIIPAQKVEKGSPTFPPVLLSLFSFVALPILRLLPLRSFRRYYYTVLGCQWNGANQIYLSVRVFAFNGLQIASFFLPFAFPSFLLSFLPGLRSRRPTISDCSECHCID